MNAAELTALLPRLEAAGILHGLGELARERLRQVEEERHEPRFDDNYDNDELVRAATCYAAVEITCDDVCASDCGWAQDFATEVWPWDAEWFKTKDRESNLRRAGALLAAELDRLHRAKVEETVTGVAGAIFGTPSVEEVDRAGD